jgi:hypothetical protein
VMARAPSGARGPAAISSWTISSLAQMRRAKAPTGGREAVRQLFHRLRSRTRPASGRVGDHAPPGARTVTTRWTLSPCRATR